MTKYLVKSTALIVLGVLLAVPALAGGFSGFGFSYGGGGSSYGVSFGHFGTSLYYGDRYGRYGVGFSDSRHRYSGHSGGYGHHSSYGYSNYGYGYGYGRAPAVRYVYREPVYYGHSYPVYRQYRRDNYHAYPAHRQYRRGHSYDYPSTRYTSASYQRNSRVIISDYPRYQPGYTNHSPRYRDDDVSRPEYHY